MTHFTTRPRPLRTARRPLLWGLAAAVLTVAIGFSSVASAASRFTDLRKEPAIMDKVELTSGRFEASPFWGVSILDGQFLRVMPVGLNLRYHPTFWLGIGLHASFSVAKLKTGTLNDVCDIRAGIFGGTAEQCGPAGEDNPPNKLRTAAWDAFLQAHIKPFYGKASLFGALFFRYQVGIFAGFGVVGTNRLELTSIAGVDNSKVRPAPTFGGDFHLFFTEFLALNVEFRDTVLLDNWYGVRDASGNLRTKANHYATFTFGVSFFIPFKAKRTR